MSFILNLRLFVVYALMCSLVLSGLLTFITRQGHASNDSLPHSSTTDETVERTTPPSETVDEMKRAHVSDAYDKLSLSFEANQGQFDRQVKFLARGGGHNLFLTASEAVLILTRSVADKTKSRGANSLDALKAKEGRLQSRSRGAEGFRGAGEVEAAAPNATVLRMGLEGANSAPQMEVYRRCERRVKEERSVGYAFSWEGLLSSE